MRDLELHTRESLENIFQGVNRFPASSTSF